ncbi:MAG: hypothetical protein M5R36_00825 [Deltaproteobacteria bacterium]|nr:hypothetical protein [Deltaproteobacteria bacterium]
MGGENGNRSCGHVERNFEERAAFQVPRRRKQSPDDVGQHRRPKAVHHINDEHEGGIDRKTDVGIGDINRGERRQDGGREEDDQSGIAGMR